MKRIVTISLVLAAMIAVGIIAYAMGQSKSQPSTVTPTAPTSFTMAQVSVHATNEDCWLAINGRVYNASNISSQHPGGIEAILGFCGKDATTAFMNKGNQGQPHSQEAMKALEGLYIGTLR